MQAKPEMPDMKAEAEPLPVKLSTAPPAKTKSTPTTKSKVTPIAGASPGLPAEPADASAASRGIQTADLKVESPVPAAAAPSTLSAPPAPSTVSMATCHAANARKTGAVLAGARAIGPG